MFLCYILGISTFDFRWDAACDAGLIGSCCALMALAGAPGIATFINLRNRTSEVLKLKRAKKKEEGKEETDNKA